MVDLSKVKYQLIISIGQRKCILKLIRRRTPLGLVQTRHRRIRIGKTLATDKVAVRCIYIPVKGHLRASRIDPVEGTLYIHREDLLNKGAFSIRSPYRDAAKSAHRRVSQSQHTATQTRTNQWIGVRFDAKGQVGRSVDITEVILQIVLVR